MAVIPGWVGRLGVLVAVVGSVLLVRWLDSSFDLGRTRRSRLLLGLPWGTFVSMGIVLSVYLFVQSGLSHWYNPVVVAFRSWSYLYPLGVAVSGFAHQSAGHLLGNLFGTLVLGSLAEYAWGHFPEERGTTTFSSIRTNPFARAFVVFPAGVVAVGLLTGLFAAGPVAGFSGVVYAFAGFALVRYPLGTVVALTADDAVGTVYRALQEPVVTREAGSRFIQPWWAGVSLQGHLLGVLLGALLGILVFRRRAVRPSTTRLWTGGLLFGIAQNLWIVWWYRGNDAYVLYRVIGLWLVVVLALLIATALSASDREFPAWLTVRNAAVGLLALVVAGWGAWIALGPSLGLPTVGTPAGEVSVVTVGFLLVVALLGAAAVVLGDEPLIEGATRRDVAPILILVPLVFTAGVAVPVSLATVDDPTPPGRVSIDVRDYTVTYAENVTSQMVSVVDVSVMGETTSVRTSGVIVINEDRHIWTTMATTSRLAFTGRYRITLGGVGWRETVTALRRGWSMAGGPPAYAVWLRPPDGDFRLAYRSDRALAAPRLAGYRVGIRPGSNRFVLDLVRNGSVVATTQIPRRGNRTTLRGLTFVREGRTLFATFDGTRVKVAARETYQ